MQPHIFFKDTYILLSLIVTGDSIFRVFIYLTTLAVWAWGKFQRYEQFNVCESIIMCKIWAVQVHNSVKSRKVFKTTMHCLATLKQFQYHWNSYYNEIHSCLIIKQDFLAKKPFLYHRNRYIQVLMKVSKVAKIRNRYNQVPHLTHDTNGKVTNSQKTPQTRAKRSALSQQVTTKHI